MKKNPLLIIVNIFLLIAIFYASTSLTISFFGSFGEGNIKTSNLILAIVNDSCKVFLPICIGISLIRQKYFHATILIMIVLGTVTMSYLASQGTDLNLNNEILIETSNKSEIEAIKTELTTKLNDTKAEKQKELSTYENEIKNLPGNYYSKKQEILNSMNAVSLQYDASIKQIEGQLEKVNEKLLSGDLGSSKTTKGYNALSESIGLEVSTIVKYKNIFLELLSVILSLNLGMLLGEKQLIAPGKKEEKPQPRSQPKLESAKKFTVKAMETAKKKLRLVK